MGDSTGEIREELAQQRSDAERKVSSLRVRTARTAKRMAPVMGAAAVGALLVGAGLGAGVVLVGRRRRTPIDEGLKRLQALGSAIKGGVPPVRIEIGRNPTADPEQARWLGVLLKVAEAAGSAGGAALAGRLVRRSR